ncbi:MAG TPA: cation diffusion facilitator family transporter [Thermoanaerobaculia bacterium]|nr:cation diffusion facilitator family transporter [Thermoanaerobaculia bacterium]
MMMTTTRPQPAAAQRFALLSIAAAIVTIGMKTTAWKLTGSVGLLSDAVESIVNLLAALVAFWALRVAAQPPDAEHPFGHSKAEYLASAFEGIAILGAAIAIAMTAWKRIADPQPLENVGLGLAVAVGAAAVNGVVAFVLLRAGRRLDSITLRSDAHHLMTDVWTSGGVLVGILIVKLTGWLVLDPIVALAVATNIVWMAAKILLETAQGLLDRTIPAAEQKQLDDVLAKFRGDGVEVHAVRARQAGPVRFIDMHVLVPGSWSVQRGHDLCEGIESGVKSLFPRSSVLTHLEPAEDPTAWDDPAGGPNAS